MNWLKQDNIHVAFACDIKAELFINHRYWILTTCGLYIRVLSSERTEQDAKSAAEKMLIEIFEDAIKELVGPDKQAVFNYVMPSAHNELNP